MIPGSGTLQIDPLVAIGYDYNSCGTNSPNFSSVLLPSGVGDGQFNVSFNGQNFVVAGGTRFNIAAQTGGVGVCAFRVTGIELTAGINPSDPLGFITDVGFTGAGTFSGFMRAIVDDLGPTPGVLPEPGTLALGAGLVAAIAAIRRRRVSA